MTATQRAIDDLCPLFGLRVTTPRLELRLPREEELVALATSAPDDLETDPSWPAPPGARMPGAAIVHGFWRALGGWRTDRWALPLAVFAGGKPVGFQTLEASRLATLRTVDTASWLRSEHRGMGIGKEMRAAALALAFDHLGAEVATSSAWESNGASLGVSRALGYVDNGWHRHEHEGRVTVMRHLVLERRRWDRDARPATVHGLDAALPWFGAPD